MKKALADRFRTVDAARRLSQSEAVERLVAFSEHLAPHDRALLTGVYKHGISPSLLALATGQSRRRVQNRLRRLMRRVQSPLYQFVVRRRLDWPDGLRAIAEAIVLRGQTQRATALMMGMSVHEVRVELLRIRSLFEQSRARPDIQVSRLSPFAGR